MSRIAHYIVFAVTYILVGVLLQFALESIYEQGSSHWIGKAIPFVSAPIAILAAQRFGQLALPGLALSGIICAFAVQVAIWWTLHSIALPTGGSISFFSLYTAGGWNFALSTLWLIACPVLWQLLVFSGPTNRSYHSGHA
jgi:hypothetical protein